MYCRGSLPRRIALQLYNNQLTKMKNHPKPLLKHFYYACETLNVIITKQLTPIVSPLKRFVKHLNPIIINHLHTVSFKSKFLRLPNASNVFILPLKSLSRIIGRAASLIDWQGGCKLIYHN